jgi:hypothetical protein
VSPSDARAVIGQAMERALAHGFALQCSMQRLGEFVLDNLSASKYTIVKLKLQVKRSAEEVGGHEGSGMQDRHES